MTVSVSVMTPRASTSSCDTSPECQNAFVFFAFKTCSLCFVRDGAWRKITCCLAVYVLACEQKRLTGMREGVYSGS